MKKNVKKNSKLLNKFFLKLRKMGFDQRSEVQPKPEKKILKNVKKKNYFYFSIEEIIL